MPTTAQRLRDLIDRLGHLLRARTRAADGELAPVHVDALAYLVRANRYSNGPVALAEFLGLTKGTVSQTLRVLEQRGLVARRALGKASGTALGQAPLRDGRRVAFLVTAKGRRRLSACTQDDRWDEAVRSLAANGSAAADALEAALRDMQRRHGSRTFGVCRTCRFFQPGPGGQHTCGLTREPLTDVDATLLCREHEEPAA